jgi:hypothetical protein
MIQKYHSQRQISSTKIPLALSFGIWYGIILAMLRHEGKRLPPYVSYRTFRNFLESLKSGIPSRIDRSYWGTKFSGSTGIQLVTALRFLTLVEESNAPTERLVQLVQADRERKRVLLRAILEQAYAPILKGLDLSRATPAELGERFAQAGATGDVGRKCLSFFVASAAEAGLPLSSFILQRAKPRLAPRARRRAPRRKEPAPSSPGRLHPALSGLLHELPDPASGWDRDGKERFKRAFEAALDLVYPTEE